MSDSRQRGDVRQRIGVSVEGTLFFLVLEGAFLYNDSINTKDFIYYFVVNTRIWKYNIVKDFKEDRKSVV